MEKYEENKLFMDVMYYIIDNGMADNLGEIAKRANIGQNTISRIKNGRVKVGDDTIRKICAAYGEINIEYMRGRSQFISVYDNFENELKITSKIGSETVDSGDYMKKYIASLEKQVKDKDQQIADLRRNIQLLYSRLQNVTTSDNMRANIFSSIAADELQEPAKDK